MLIYQRVSSILLATTALSLAPTIARASVVDLTFEGLTGYSKILDYYNGGTSSDGKSGTNYGVSFSDNALSLPLNTLTDHPSNTSKGGLGDPNSRLGALVFLSGDQTYLNIAAGFTDGFSFNYSAPNHTGSVEVFDGVNGTGNLLATINLGLTPSTCPSGYGAAYCPFVAIGVNFTGTAKSISFAGTANYITFDDVTFGSSTPGMSNVPLPPALPLFGAAVLGLVGASRLRQSAKSRA